jgi:hypothetical protein
VENPYEAAFFLLAGISYLQAFEDGNKRVGRLACNIPLLSNSLPPISFTTMRASDYVAGLTVFYESGDLSVLADIIAEGYAQTAMLYSSSQASRRVPHQIEIRMRHEIDDTIQHVITKKIIDSFVIGELVKSRFRDVFRRDLEIVQSSVLDVVSNMTPENAIAWGVDANLAGEYRALRLPMSAPEPQ